ncbi:MAG: hypothetical protein RLY86_150 [Pseudomonadota bacterium]|jgi:hypothetical protein
MVSYRAVGHQLLAPDDTCLLGGPLAELAAFAIVLNEERPEGHEALCAALQRLIGATRDCSFAPFIDLTVGTDDCYETDRQDPWFRNTGGRPPVSDTATVLLACARLDEAGRLSVRELRRELGGGSPGRLAPIIRRFREGQADGA